MEKDIYEDIRDPKFANRFLGRLASDCEYILNACMDAYDRGDIKDKKGSLRHLWAQNDVDEQISLMRACKRTLDKHKIKSRISDEDIDDYESKLKRVEKFNESNSSFQALKKEIRELYEDMQINYYRDYNYPNTNKKFILGYKLKNSTKDNLSSIVEIILDEINTQIKKDKKEYGQPDDDLIYYRNRFKEILNKLI